MSIDLFQPIALLAESPSSEFFLKISWGAVLLSGSTFFLLGTLAGWFIWGAYQGRAKSIEKENSALLHRQEEMENSFAEYRKKYGNPDGNLEDSPAS